MDTAYDDEIRSRAHQLWEEEGRPHGSDREHWHRAELEIEQQRSITRQPRGTPTLPEVAVPGNVPIVPERR